MLKIEEFEANPDVLPLEARGISFPSLLDLVMKQGCVVIKRCFPADTLEKVRDAVHAWGASHPITPPQTYIDENFHSLESGISPRQKTPHVYHAYNFTRPLELPAELKATTLPVFERLRVFQNALTGNAATFEPDQDGRKARPQIIHYPSGGGMFGKHTHPLEPQRVGLILGLSKRGKDYDNGSTHFEMGGVRSGTDHVHDQGDLILFRFDIPHWISAIDQGEKFDPASPKGRWTAVLPYY